MKLRGIWNGGGVLRLERTWRRLNTNVFDTQMEGRLPTARVLVHRRDDVLEQDGRI
ncbi:MAG: hypothetical protein IPP07_15010 [Holophagales bacterium]|nr:hypothetical protein [Holophagales bacterium]